MTDEKLHIEQVKENGKKLNSELLNATRSLNINIIKDLIEKGAKPKDTI